MPPLSPSFPTLPTVFRRFPDVLPMVPPRLPMAHNTKKLFRFFRRFSDTDWARRKTIGSDVFPMLGSNFFIYQRFIMVSTEPVVLSTTLPSFPFIPQRFYMVPNTWCCVIHVVVNATFTTTCITGIQDPFSNLRETEAKLRIGKTSAKRVGGSAWWKGTSMLMN